MFDFFARLFRILWRQDLGGTGASAVILEFPAAAMQSSDVAAAPVAFIRQAGDVASQAVSTAPLAKRHLSAQLHSVARLNGPTSRARGRAPAVSGGAQKPKPVAAAATLKRAPVAKPGVVIGRMVKTGARGGAAIVDLAEVRADVRRAKVVDTFDREIVALFN